MYKKKILILQPIIAHYRKTVFTMLVENKEYEFTFIAGKSYENIQGLTIKNSILLPYFSFNFFGHKFYYLKGSLKNINSINPDIIISSGIDFHLLHTILVFIIYKIIKRKKFLWWSHATQGKQGKIGRLARMFFYKRSSGIMTYSQAGKDFLISNGVKLSKTIAIGNALNTEDYGFLNNSLKTNKKPTSHFKLLFSGRLTNYRRLEILLYALERIKNNYKDRIVLTILGGGDDQELISLCKKLNIENEVVFTGPIYGQEANKCFHMADLMVYPKAIGLSIVHAYSFGIPVITCNNLEIQMPEIELLIPGENGDFYKDENINDLVDKIILWKNKISKEGDKLSKEIIDHLIETEYLPEKVSEKILDFLKKIK